ncbi:hypothetical protein AB3R30_25240 [Leptolyngbyaceae cyanobacterium UHCC 1019]
MLGSSFARFAIASVLPIVALVSSAYPSIAEESYSGIRIPVEEAAAKLKARTNVPIFIPDMIPIGIEEDVHITLKSNDRGYEMNFGFIPDCNGQTYCHIGSITAERGGQFSPKSGARIYEGVQLRGGMKALHTQFCGAVCQANLEWKVGGVLYRINIKNGVYESLIGAANSAVNAGQR